MSNEVVLLNFCQAHLSFCPEGEIALAEKDVEYVSTKKRICPTKAPFY